MPYLTTCRVCAQRIDGEPALDERQFFVHPHCQSAQDQQIALRAAAPLRKPVEQHDVDGLGLFDAVRSPSML